MVLTDIYNPEDAGSSEIGLSQKGAKVIYDAIAEVDEVAGTAINDLYSKIEGLEGGQQAAGEDLDGKVKEIYQVIEDNEYVTALMLERLRKQGDKLEKAIIDDEEVIVETFNIIRKDVLNNTNDIATIEETLSTALTANNENISSCQDEVSLLKTKISLLENKIAALEKTIATPPIETANEGGTTEEPNPESRPTT